MWKLAFQNEHKTVNEIRLSKRYENKYSNAVVESFLATYGGIKEIKMPSHYSFPFPPTLMQWYVAYKVKNLPYFGNFSGECHYCKNRISITTVPDFIAFCDIDCAEDINISRKFI